jgi:hypothetical protein
MNNGEDKREQLQADCAGNGAYSRVPDPEHLEEAVYWCANRKSFHGTGKHFSRNDDTIRKWACAEEWEVWSRQRALQFRDRYDAIIYGFLQKLEDALRNGLEFANARDAIAFLKLVQEELGGKSDPNRSAKLELTGSLATDSYFSDIPNNPEVAAAIQRIIAGLARDTGNTCVDDKQ